jgi:hypothetical protein
MKLINSKLFSSTFSYIYLCAYGKKSFFFYNQAGKRNQTTTTKTGQRVVTPLVTLRFLNKMINGVLVSERKFEERVKVFFVNYSFGEFSSLKITTQYLLYT